MRTIAGVLLAVAGCAGSGAPAPAPCGDDELVRVWIDADGDGWGGEELAERQCADVSLAEDQVLLGRDCDDGDPDIGPDAEEACDGLDNDCNGEVDEGLADNVLWYFDGDGDGFGTQFPAMLACAKPGPEWVKNVDDCDDTDPDISPDGIEVCNDGLDDDCDGLSDDLDPNVNPASMQSWYLDDDADGYGDATDVELQCRRPAGRVDNADDCNDTTPVISPGSPELCNGIDDDCDLLVDDADPVVDPASQTTFFADYDDDGFGDANVTILACEVGLGASDNDLDCDDNDPIVTIPVDWYVDQDGDLAGVGSAIAYQCLAPGPNTAPFNPDGQDCDDSDPARFPGNLEICNDGVDQDCDSSDNCTSCKQWQDTDPLSPSGTYSVQPLSPGPSYDVWCDMDTDGGGWTLVASTRDTTFDDKGGTYYADLANEIPVTGATHVWNGMRDVVVANSDIRFTCIDNGVDTVDLSFYDVPWYRTITTGTSDTDSCFVEGGQSISPARRDNIAGVSLIAGNTYNSGSMEGEDSCSDTGDFTVDFDDRGMDSNQSDGTDWGEDDSTEKCGTSPGGDVWFIYVREP